MKCSAQHLSISVYVMINGQLIRVGTCGKFNNGEKELRVGGGMIKFIDENL